MRVIKTVPAHTLGFTVVEMMVVVTVVAIVTLSAIPAFQSFVLNNRSANIANRLANSFRLARAEALNSGHATIVCPITPGLSVNAIYPENICNLDTTIWDAWLIFTDKNANTLDEANEAIRYYENIQPGTVTSNSKAHVVYDSSGFCTSGGHVFIIKPPGCTGNNARRVEVKPAGSIQVDFLDCSRK